MTGELAAANPVLATAPTARIAERKRIFLVIIWSLSPCGKADSEIVPQKLYNFYNKSNFFLPQPGFSTILVWNAPRLRVPRLRFGGEEGVKMGENGRGTAF